jgi:hypothetical protein
MVAEWLARAGDITLAYVSDRRTDTRVLYRCVVVITKPNDHPSHIIQAPSGQDVWLMFTRNQGILSFPTLSEALNSIRPVLVEAD